MRGQEGGSCSSVGMELVRERKPEGGICREGGKEEAVAGEGTGGREGVARGLEGGREGAEWREGAVGREGRAEGW